MRLSFPPITMDTEGNFHAEHRALLEHLVGGVDPEIADFLSKWKTHMSESGISNLLLFQVIRDSKK